ncbi:DNA repair protein [Salmonella bongori]|uniref:DNA repair protein n=1 Tax=Salmonella bongori serovar 44:r:- TaxID=1967585 RepID=A0A702BPF8_SALBN|nr:DnaJ family molecular chaperone [Salmonella bongori]EGE4654074.1 DNA repair protein [Salmonella bongori serovar 40:z35:- str. 95-0123]EGE4659132.1 DNA repair protein [Salmonella bongori serovar 48:i:- str. 94-0708]EGS1128434.1 DNA repair protein [Salmonella bongori CFSAN000509]HAC6693756.1 DNA repair protein [Salmonella bongori serovar 44:r:-]AID24250.1 DNA repair ATPase [Salmonella bongori serovar 48:z41:-- str. RKS3044]
MKKIIKRLEIIKSAIELEDEEIIRQQLIHLKNEPQDAVITTIVQAIEARRFSDAMQNISAWLQAQRALSTWQDPSVAASKLELKALEAQLRDLIDKRNARVQILDDFNDLYHLRLGPLMSRILELRQQLAVSMQRKQEAELKRREKDYQSCLQYISRAVDQLATLKQQWVVLNTASREAVGFRQRIQQQTELITALLAEIRELEESFSHQNNSASRQAQENAEQEYHQYREQQQEAQFRYARDQRLSADERSELKRLWRQASRLCHPDVVADELKEKAHQMMVQLNQARQNADLVTIRTLLTQLQSGLEPMMASDRLNNLEHLRNKIRQLRTQIDALLKEITQLETENAWRLASSVTDKEAYFSEQERALTEIRNSLEAQVQQVEKELLTG